MQLKHTLARYLSKELDYCREDILEALTKFEDEYEENQL